MIEIIYTVLGVFIGGLCTYEYSMWRTKRYIKKLIKTEMPKLLPSIIKPFFPGIQADPESPVFKILKREKPDHYE